MIDTFQRMPHGKSTVGGEIPLYLFFRIKLSQIIKLSREINLHGKIPQDMFYIRWAINLLPLRKVLYTSWKVLHKRLFCST